MVTAIQIRFQRSHKHCIQQALLKLINTDNTYIYRSMLYRDTVTKHVYLFEILISKKLHPVELDTLLTQPV